MTDVPPAQDPPRQEATTCGLPVSRCVVLHERNVPFASSTKQLLPKLKHLWLGLGTRSLRLNGATQVDWNEESVPGKTSSLPRAEMDDTQTVHASPRELLWHDGYLSPYLDHILLPRVR